MTNEPHVVMACCGYVPTLERREVSLLRTHVPSAKGQGSERSRLDEASASVRTSARSVVKEFDSLFTRDKPIIFAFHGYPWLIHRLTYRRTNHKNLHVRGYKEEGTTTTPFDMAVMNDLDRFGLVTDVIDRVPKLGASAGYVKQYMRDKRIEHKEYIGKFGEDMPEIRDWKWPHA